MRGRREGPTINGEVTLQPTDHLALDIIENVRWSTWTAGGDACPLFTQRVQRVKGTYTFTSRMFVRVIGQYVSRRSDPTLYRSTRRARPATSAARRSSPTRSTGSR